MAETIKKPASKKEMMARLSDERRAQGLKKRSYWLDDQQNELVKKFIENLKEKD